MYHPYCHSLSALTEYLKQKLCLQWAKRLGRSLPAQVKPNVQLEHNNTPMLFINFVTFRFSVVRLLFSYFHKQLLHFGWTSLITQIHWTALFPLLPPSPFIKAHVRYDLSNFLRPYLYDTIWRILRASLVRCGSDNNTCMISISEPPPL